MNYLLIAVAVLLVNPCSVTAQESVQVNADRCISTYNGVMALYGGNPSMHAGSYQITTAKYFPAEGYDTEETRVLGIFHLFDGNVLPAYCSIYPEGVTDVVLYGQSDEAAVFSYHPDRGWSFEPNSRYYSGDWYRDFEQ